MAFMKSINNSVKCLPSRNQLRLHSTSEIYFKDWRATRERCIHFKSGCVSAQVYAALESTGQTSSTYSAAFSCTCGDLWINKQTEILSTQFFINGLRFA